MLKYLSTKQVSSEKFPLSQPQILSYYGFCVDSAVSFPPKHKQHCIFIYRNVITTDIPLIWLMSNIPPLRQDSKTSGIQLIWFYENCLPTKTGYHILYNIIYESILSTDSNSLLPT